MKRVLVICYYFPPCNGAPAYRPYSWAMNFKLHGLNPTVITRQWTGNESSWDDFVKMNLSPMSHEVNDLYDVYRLPSKQLKSYSLLKGNSAFERVLRKLNFALLTLRGRFSTEVDGKLTFVDFLMEHLSCNKYDAVIITVPPFNLMELKEVVDKFKIPVILDIRDLWNNLMLTDSYKPSYKQKIWDAVYSFYFTKWLKNVSLVTVIVDTFNSVLDKISIAPKEVVYNGYERFLFEKENKVKNEKFTISIIGNIYPVQNYSILLNGLKEFVANKSPEDVQIKFIGVDALPEVGLAVRKTIPKDFLIVTGRVSKELAISETVNADVLAYVGWQGTKCIISTKIFDYIASGNPVLIAPGDQDIIDKMLVESKAGLSVNTVSDCVSALNRWYSEWTTSGFVALDRNIPFVNSFSREEQAGLMAKHVLDIINNAKP
mgnify:FL=1